MSGQLPLAARRIAFALLGLSCLLDGCGSTGGDRFSFRAVAHGSAAAVGGKLDFDNGLGYHVTLTRATLHIGAVYLNQSVPSSGSQATACVLPGIYVAEVLSSLDVDALSPKEQPFAIDGDAIALEARAAELWLTDGDINAPDDSTVVLDAAGTASKGSKSYPFEAQLTIGRNRLTPVQDPAYPNANPICKQRIVSLIPVDFTPRAGGTLVISVDPTHWFTSVDFAQLPKMSATPALYEFADDASDAADIALYSALHARTGVYTLTWK